MFFVLCFVFGVYLIGIDENDLLDTQWEQHIQKQDLVSVDMKISKNNKIKEYNKTDERRIGRDDIRPNDTLLLGLFAEPAWPFVRDEFVCEVILLSHVWNYFLKMKLLAIKLTMCRRKEKKRRNEENVYLEFGGHVVLQEPELDWVLRLLDDRQHHNTGEPLVQVS